MIEKKKVAAVIAVKTFLQLKETLNKKISWTNYRIGWMNGNKLK